MHLKSLEINGFKSFSKKSILTFDDQISGIVGPNGSGKSNIAEAFRFVLGEQSFKSMRGKRGEDLIFSGNNNIPKQNRANVKIIFDNTDKKLPIDFDEVSLERVVHRDGVNEYFINNSPVRLRDINELLASANIGSSGHHIISQGEADKILNASIKDRKEILEESLGLKIFQYKKRESEKKLIKTESNIEQVESLKREIAPHLKYLKKQVEKIEEGKKLKLELLDFYKVYLKIESDYLKCEKSRLAGIVDEPKRQLALIEVQINQLESEHKNEENNELINQVKSTENKLTEIYGRKNGFARSMGQLEGQINSLRRLKEKQSIANQNQEQITLANEEVNNLKSFINSVEDNLEDHSLLKEKLADLISFLKKVLHSKNEDQNVVLYDEEIKSAESELGLLISENEKVLELEGEVREQLGTLKAELEKDKNSSFDIERKIINLMSEKNNLQKIISENAIAEDNFGRDEESFRVELAESVVLVSREVLDYEVIDISLYQNESREEQVLRRKKLERMKIKVEETVGYVSNDAIKEFEEITERDAFLTNEIMDLENSAASLRELIVDLNVQIETKFQEGLIKINKEFQHFFELMFGGGNAKLELVKIKNKVKKDLDIFSDETDFDSEGEETDSSEESEATYQEGVDIGVNLPRKKVRDLMMLSGGERALTSIALLFAISQVNPPPFIILDETDAALDEANSRKYGDMISNLSDYSQLILVTHNRETMSRAGVLYGVTMTSGVSQLLSIAFDKGLEYAK